MAEKKLSSGRRNQLKSLLLQIGQAMVEEEAWEAEQQKKEHMEEHCPGFSFPGCIQDLQVEDLKIKVQDLKGKFKKPVLKKVRMSADAMLAALLGSKHKVSMDLRGNLRQVRKEVKEEEKATGDWRKSVEDKSGMGGRKKMFETEA
ncbi:troponin I, fast skeletal muscle-like isoform X4 [Pseudoliparis swirei]|uniref:troponin I, fast skeletal muscle-like isoform X4 n=1 Tax=Pseudoliparis swirei TaxID=2059687 RepID=UPI0024BDD8A4|nr:troponin I, fast skeletal muscle-like isoform X4 [Pseudoliparis swirei]